MSFLLPHVLSGVPENLTNQLLQLHSDPVLGKRGADMRACPRKVPVFLNLGGVCNLFRRLRRLCEFAMKRIVGPEPRDR